MKYYVDNHGNVWAFELDGSQDYLITTAMRAMTEEEVYAHLNPPPTLEDFKAIESAWRTAELAIIARQLEAIEEDEADETPPDLLPGTRKQWLAHRGKVSNWKDGGNADYPDMAKRPVRPS